MNIEKAIKLPFSEDGLVKVIIGAVLNLIPIVNFLSIGYLLELMANVIQGREEMPVWDDWGNKFIKGLMVAVIAFIYFLIPMLVMMLGGGLAILTGSSGSFLFSIIGFLLILVVWFILPMALAKLCGHRQFWQRLRFRRNICDDHWFDGPVPDRFRSLHRCCHRHVNYRYDTPFRLDRYIVGRFLYRYRGLFPDRPDLPLGRQCRLIGPDLW